MPPAGAGAQVAYSCSKGAVLSLSRSLAAAWGSDNIQVNCLVPGAINTGFLDTMLANPKKARGAAAEHCCGGASKWAQLQRSAQPGGACARATGSLSHLPDHRLLLPLCSSSTFWGASRRVSHWTLQVAVAHAQPITASGALLTFPPLAPLLVSQAAWAWRRTWWGQRCSWRPMRATT